MKENQTQTSVSCPVGWMVSYGDGCAGVSLSLHIPGWLAMGNEGLLEVGKSRYKWGVTS